MKIRYIKLGDGGKWEPYCIEEKQVLRLGYESPHHQESLAGDWDTVRNFWLSARKGNNGAASRDLNQIRDFYELSEADIWVTFYRRKMYWCHAHKEVYELEDGSRIRKVIGSWSCLDKNGSPLSIENIDGRITKVQGYRGTICGVELPEYLLRKINGEVQPEIQSTKEALEALKKNVEDLIKGLWWHDFELLVDLIFAQSGWQRISVLGKAEKDIDLDIFSPVSQRRAFVQVKSTTTADQIQNYREIFSQHHQYDEMYFVFHTFLGSLKNLSINDPRVTLWDISRVAELVINAGLIDWLLAKRS
ncbi:restriction endonuclease [Aeromonas veronii]|uniref:restriction endonuclease n=1 Tax=Aeromonas veronii TaxID=654 RepID=UPI001F1FE60B|nr:restriction endonuclease [Aeromonas veronii]